MDRVPPHFHSSSPPVSAAQTRSANHPQSYSTTANRGIRKRSVSRPRSISGGHQQLEHLLPEQIRTNLTLGSGQSLQNTYDPSRQSPQPQHHPFFEPVDRFSSSAWSVPSQHRSDSGVTSIPTVDPSKQYYPPSAPVDNLARQPVSTTTAGADMGSLGYMMPPQYQGPFATETHSFGTGYSFDQPYRSTVPMQQDPYAFAQGGPAYGQGHVRTGSPLSQMTHTDEASQLSNPYDIRHQQSSASVPRAMPSTMQSMGLSSQQPGYPPAYERSASMYEHTYSPSLPRSQPFEAPSSAGTSYSQPMYSTPPQQSYQRSMSSASSTSARPSSSKPKPQCWEHGCNGREFSTFSNLLRHQREKSGTASKSYCPKCGAEFTRTTARNGHLAHDKCSKARQPSDPR